MCLLAPGLPAFQIARSPRSSVLIRITSTRFFTKIFPSSFWPVRALCFIAAIAEASNSFLTINSIFNFAENPGLPQFTRFCSIDDGKPFVSLTVIATRPSSAKALFTSSNLNGLMIASNFFILANHRACKEARGATPRPEHTCTCLSTLSRSCCCSRLADLRIQRIRLVSLRHFCQC